MRGLNFGGTTVSVIIMILAGIAMGAGYHGGFGSTEGTAAYGSADYMAKNESFSVYIARRSDVDANGYYDVIAHGNPTEIDIEHNGKTISINHRVAAKLLKHDKNYSGQSVRLLSCSTGKLPDGFAQNLANKLGVTVLAPTDLLWAKPSGRYYVTAGQNVGGKLVEDYSKPGRFKPFYPRRKRK